MKQQTIQATFGCLLHDVGKLLYRSGEGEGTHSQLGYQWLKERNHYQKQAGILDCVRYHHAKELRTASTVEQIAYIAYVADNMASAADRRSTEENGGFQRHMPLSPIFTHLNGEHPNKALRPHHTKNGQECLQMPTEDTTELTAGQYGEICHHLKQQLQELPPEEDWLNSMLSLLEGWTSTVPASTNTAESPDISLYDHLKVTAAMGACISEYLLAKKVCDYRTTLFTNEKEFWSEPAFLLYSADFSGIQKFIYTVSTTNALRSLRSRSFFLELTMEHYVDELLHACGVCRANLLYSGGGHCYVLLPNTTDVIDTLNAWNQRFNEFLTEQFGIQLYLADGYTVCTANELTNHPQEDAPYSAMFRRVSQAVAKKKLHRYTAQQLRQMNQGSGTTNGRECRVCGRTDRLKDSENGTQLCYWCSTLENLSQRIQEKERFVYVVSRQTKGADFVLPLQDGEAGYFLTTQEDARRRLGQEEPLVRIYTKNIACAGLRYSTRLYVGDYASSNCMDELAKQSDGISRLAVCRMDVDNLGQAFVSGFENPHAKSVAERQHFVTLSRTAAFSRQVSLFFKYHINALLSGEYGSQTALQVAIVYSGGDDVFLVGAWTDVLQAAERIHKALQEYSCGALTVSAGIGLYHSHFPIRYAAQLTAELEDEAKSLPQKNGVALFECKWVQGENGLPCHVSEHTYPWEVYTKKVCEEKLVELQRFFDENDERGMAFLYRLTALLREASDTNRLPLARYAYLLSRLEPKQNSPQYTLYRAFSQRMYHWACNEEDRQQLLTAILLYVYRQRKKESD